MALAITYNTDASGVSHENLILGPVPFPLLTYLSLNYATGLKPHMDAPNLVTYHEGGSTVKESFQTSLQSIMEYGVYNLASTVLNVTDLHHSFPNVSRLAIRAYSESILSMLDPLAIHLHLLLALRTISVRSIHYDLTERAKELILDIVRTRSKACQTDIALYFETRWPFQIPIFIGPVSHWPTRRFLIY